MIDTAKNIRTAVQARRDLLALVTMNDPHLTPDGLRARRKNDLDSIRGRLTAVMPAEPTMPDRQPVLDALAPKTADDLAFQAREWEKVRTMMGAGRRLEQIIANAERTRLAAILDNLETMPEVLDSAHGPAIVEEFQSVIWDRLTQVDSAAGQVAAAEVATAPAFAWRAVLEGLRDTGVLPYDGLVLLHRADPEAYRLLMDGDAEATSGSASGAIPPLVEALDRTPATV